MVLLVVATPLVFWGAVRVYPNTTVGKRVLLKNPSAEAVGGFKEEAAKLERFMGKQGVALTLLRPAGSVEVDGERIDALSEAEVIEAGTRVEVVQVIGMKVMVKRVEDV